MGQDFVFTTDDTGSVPVVPEHPTAPGGGAGVGDSAAQTEGAGVLPDTGGAASELPMAALLLVLIGSFLVVAARPPSS